MSSNLRNKMHANKKRSKNVALFLINSLINLSYMNYLHFPECYLLEFHTNADSYSVTLLRLLRK